MSTNEFTNQLADNMTIKHDIKQGYEMGFKRNIEAWVVCLESSNVILECHIVLLHNE